MPSKLMSRRSFLKAVMASSAGLAIMQTNSILFAQAGTDSIVEDLAQNAFSSLTEPETQKWWKAYQTLSYEQVDLLTDMLADSASRQLATQGKSTKATKAFKQLRKEANKLAKKQYQVPLSRLSFSELDNVLDIIAKSQDGQSIRAEISALASCACFNYVYTTTPGGMGAPGNGQYYQMASQQASQCGDCDWDVTYPVNRQIIRYTTPQGYGHYSQKGGRFIFRRTPTTTCVVFGFWTTLFWQIDPWLLTWDFRLD